MKDEDSPVSPDEIVVRLIWKDYYRPNEARLVRDRAFLPRPSDDIGLSVFRLACLGDARGALAVMAPEKRDQYALALLPVADLLALGLSVEPAKIETVPGHAVIPELNAALVASDGKRCADIQKALVALAAKNLIPPAEPKT